METVRRGSGKVKTDNMPAIGRLQTIISEPFKLANPRLEPNRLPWWVVQPITARAQRGARAPKELPMSC